MLIWFPLELKSALIFWSYSYANLRYRNIKHYHIITLIVQNVKNAQDKLQYS